MTREQRWNQVLCDAGEQPLWPEDGESFLIEETARVAVERLRDRLGYSFTQERLTTWLNSGNQRL